MWDTGKRPPCTRLKDLDSAGMEKLTSFCAMSGFPRRQVKYQDFNNVHTAGLDGEKSKEGGERKKRKKEGKKKLPQEGPQHVATLPAYMEYIRTCKK